MRALDPAPPARWLQWKNVLEEQNLAPPEAAPVRCGVGCRLRCTSVATLHKYTASVWHAAPELVRIAIKGCPTKRNRGVRALSHMISVWPVVGWRWPGVQPAHPTRNPKTVAPLLQPYISTPSSQRLAGAGPLSDPHSATRGPANVAPLVQPYISTPSSQ